jgi:nicotinamide-nucleotide adenylyltransferase
VADSSVDMKKILLIPVSDVNMHSLWTHQVDILVPKYNVVFTNDILTALLFKQREIEVVEPSLYRRKELSATEVRSRMAKDEDWKELVTIQTAKVVEDIHGIERIKAIIAKHTA